MLSPIAVARMSRARVAIGLGSFIASRIPIISVFPEHCLSIASSAKPIRWFTISINPSAELRPDQKDSDSLPDYSILDKVLYQYIERRQGPKEIKAMGYDAVLVDRILKMVNVNEYKRNQFCPIIRISPKAFGVGRRVPIVGKYLS